MANSLSPEMFWTVLTAGLTAVFWTPYVVQRLIEKGILEGFRDPTHASPTKAAWAQRAIRAHANGVENLVVFAVLAVALQFSGKGTATTALAAEIFFFARAAHFVIYALGLPWLRVCAFLTGFACQVVLFVTVLGWM